MVTHRQRATWLLWAPTGFRHVRCVDMQFAFRNICVFLMLYRLLECLERCVYFIKFGYLKSKTVPPGKCFPGRHFARLDLSSYFLDCLPSVLKCSYRWSIDFITNHLAKLSYVADIFEKRQF